MNSLRHGRLIQYQKMKYKAKCINDKQKVSGLMFILNEEYLVSKYNGSVFLNYVTVEGLFSNDKETFGAERIISKETCEKHLKIFN